MVARIARGAVRRARSRLASARAQRQHRVLNGIDFHSGLGDSANLLYGLVRTAKPQVVVEIGSARGCSTCFMAMALKENGHGKLFAIDPHTRTAWNDTDSVETYSILIENLRKCGLEEYVEVIRKTSGEARRTWNLPIDLLFIDGDHSYEGVKRDWELFSPFVQPFGLTIFHDTLWDLAPDPTYARADMGVPRFVDELREQGYPVITLNQNFGVSIVQPTKKGIPLHTEQTNSTARELEVVGS